MSTANTKKTYYTYTLKANDSLNTLAQKFSLSVNEICKFHNELSGSKKNISAANGIPFHVSKIFLPATVKNNKQEKTFTKSTPINLTNQNSLRCNFNVLNHNYGIVIFINTQKETKRIHYTAAVNYEKEYDYTYEFVLKKNEVYVDYKIPNLLAEDFAISLAKPLYPIHTKINKKGKLIGVTNQQEIFKRWEKAKPKILNYFKSPFANEQIQIANKAYQSTIAIEKAIQRDVFFTLYFSGVYNKYLSKLEISNTVNIPFYPFITAIQYQVKQTIQPFLNANNNIVMQQLGAVCDKRSSKDIEQNNDQPYFKGTPLEGNLDVTYEFCNKNYTIKSIIGTITLVLNKKLDKKITIEAYHLI
ncbi:hypothetical protein A5M85_03680 [Cellulophaga lytica]|uniref:hypothetical protein n=1 Tax=Cellulophaga lytica TaxID=979 RepID=UPI0009503642|nr:hypothetical protein [Cellulophaga lytica]APU09412.1 hypothetical protein A5M85_03680 [Cellulophaga lytica]